VICTRTGSGVEPIASAPSRVVSDVSAAASAGTSTLTTRMISSWRSASRVRSSAAAE
jgi:hypothetical protein